MTTHSKFIRANPKFVRVAAVDHRQVEAGWPLKFPASAVTHAISDMRLPQQVATIAPKGLADVSAALGQLTSYPEIVTAVEKSPILGLGTAGANGVITETEASLDDLVRQPARFKTLSLANVKASFQRIRDFLSAKGLGGTILSRILGGLNTAADLAKFLPPLAIAGYLWTQYQEPDTSKALQTVQSDPSQAQFGSAGAAFQAANGVSGNIGAAWQGTGMSYVAPNYVTTQTSKAPLMMNTTGESNSGSGLASPYRYDTNGYILTNPDNASTQTQ